MNNKRLTIEVEFTEYSDLVSNFLLRLAKSGSEILPGLKVIRVVNEKENENAQQPVKITEKPNDKKPNIKKTNSIYSNYNTTMNPYDSGWIEMTGEQIDLPNILI